MFPKDTRILIVDDQGVMRKLVKKYLSDLGYLAVWEADDGATAWPKYIEAIADQRPFELVICDWTMPLMSGLELLVKVRQYEQYANIPFVLLTAETTRACVTSAAQFKVSSYIAKPFTFETFQSKLAEVFENLSQSAA